MADHMTPQQRHRCMSRIGSKDTQPELLVRRWLWRQGFRYRLHDKRLPGTPDIVMHQFRTVIFVNGCFWHGHDCEHFRLPTTNAEFWRKKIDNNRRRDRLNRGMLKYAGWHVLTVWECQLAKATRQATLKQLSTQLSTIILDHFQPRPATKPSPYTIGDTTSLAAEP